MFNRCGPDGRRESILAAPGAPLSEQRSLTSPCHIGLRYRMVVHRSPYAKQLRSRRCPYRMAMGVVGAFEMVDLDCGDRALRRWGECPVSIASIILRRSARPVRADARGAIDQRFARLNRASLQFQNFLCSICTRETRRHEYALLADSLPVTDRLSRRPAHPALRPGASAPARDPGIRSTHAISTRVFSMDISGSSDTRTVADTATRRGGSLT